jgi:transcriptional regulator of arginine metabolism
MKRKRHEKIIELIEQYDIETQDELADRLREAGFQVTQATVSRDIRELQLSKVSNKGGTRQKYALLKHPDHQMGEKYIGIMREAFISMDQAQNILVIKTVSGMAMAVGAALDNIGWKEIVGCIAGDDTVMCVIRTAEETREVMKELEKIVKA